MSRLSRHLLLLGDQFYKDAIEQCRSYNARLCAERSVRLPFLDSQTGVAQNNCYIWMERHHRSPGVTAGQMYTYPARCWRKKRRLENSTDARLGIYGLHLEVAGGGRLRAAESASLTLPWVRREGGGCLVAELKVNVRRHNGEGPPPPHEGEARFSSPPHDYLGGAAPTINILQRHLQRIRAATKRSATCKYNPQTRLAFKTPCLLCFVCSNLLASHDVCSAVQLAVEDPLVPRSGGSLMTKDSLPSQSTTLEALLRGEGLDRRNNSKNDEESLLEIQRVLEADAAEDAFDDDDYEVDTPKRRHRGKGRGRGSGRRRADADDDKPYICDNRYKQKQNSKSSTSVYAKRYRNRTGLSYHYTHSHLAEEERARGRGSVVSRSPSAQQTDRHKRPKGPGGMSIPNNYCSKCHGANKKMAKSGLPYSGCQCTTDGGEEKEDGAFAGAEELFGTTSESDTSTFHGFEDDELEEPAANGNGIPNRHR
ncbi:Zinc finger protein DPF3 [Takifugu flavidus]|uniref:Zinc finger protein DPF3 n=1 Tax=Takifugu flavidus TaxID=433684 RepID=A0A5C6P250_9TELE|nr:Zinc finger protein DPF3 [Takifugu flavidus]